MALTLHKSQLHCSGDAVMSLQFTHVHSFACTLTLRNLQARCSTVAHGCVTITWQRIFKGWLPVTIINALFRMWLFTSDIFSRRCSEAVTADNGKACCFMLCENKKGWIWSNASASTSLKNPLKCEIVSVTNVPEWIAQSSYAYTGFFPNSKKLRGLLKIPL